MKLSIAIPVYNEEERLPPRLRPFLAYLEKHLRNYEIILVNDGSTDNTLAVLKKLSTVNPKIKVIHSDINRGRGFGMKTGILAAQGDYILETDADLPVSPDHILRYVDFLECHPGYDFVIGSRVHPGSRFVQQQPLLRVIAGYVFHFIFQLLFGIRSWDVMCGFKMFRRPAAYDIFQHVFDDRYLAAAEIIFVAKKFGYKFKEMPVVWEDDRRSKVRILSDTIKTLNGLALMSIRNYQGKYDKKPS